MEALPEPGRVPPRPASLLHPMNQSKSTRTVASVWRHSTLVIVVAFVILGGCGIATWHWRAWRESFAGRRALAEGRYQDAQDAAERLLGLRLREAEANYLRAKAAIALGRRGEYVDGLKRAEAMGYPREQLAVLRALIDAQFGRVTEAQPILARAFADSEHGTPDLMVDEALARVYLDRYDFAHASAVLIRWAKDAPDDPRPPWWRRAESPSRRRSRRHHRRLSRGVKTGPSPPRRPPRNCGTA